MPEIIEPVNPDEAAEQVAALQDVPPEEEDVQAHSDIGGGASLSATSVIACCDMTA